MARTGNDKPAMRIVFVLSSLPAGGLERVTLALIEGLLVRGHHVELWLERREGAYLAHLPDGTVCIGLATTSKWRACRQLLACWPREALALAGRMLWPKAAYIPIGRLASLAEQVETRRPDIVVAAAGRMPFLALWARRMARADTRVVIAEHSTFSARRDALDDDPAGRGRMAYRGGLIRRLYRRADAVIAVSTGVADDIARLAGLARERVRTIANPVVGPALKSAAAKAPTHPWFQASAGHAPVVLAAGRLAPEKAFHVLIDAFARLHRTRSDLRLVIIGEGGERPRLEARIAEQGLHETVCLPGWQDNPYALMARSRLFVSSSRFEGLPVGIIEALACGCPVVATDCPSGPREILQDGQLGRLVPVDDARALATAMANALDEPADVAALMARGDDYSVAAAIAAYENLFHALIETAHA